MAVVDSLSLLLNNLNDVIEEYKTWSINFLAVVGALYVTKFTLQYGSYCVYKIWIYYKHTSHKNFVKLYGRWAIVTGCTSGIGEAFAKQLASRGMNIILISRNKEKLESCARFLERRYGVKTCIFIHDFNDTSAETYEAMKNGLKKFEIGILINNVGIHYDYPMYLTEVPHNILNSMCQINITSSILMTKMVASLMSIRKKGLIVNMSSGASWSANPLISTYGASKAFLSFFSEAMNLELRQCNIHVQCLEPLYIATPMTSYSQAINSSKFFTPDANTFVKNAVKTFGNVNRTTGYYGHSFQRVIFNWIPSWLYNSMTRRFHLHLNKEGADFKRKHT